MEQVNVVFCVVTYKNHTDLVEFIENAKLIIAGGENFSYKIIVINNYADDNSLKKIKEISQLNDCIFIESENKGYGYGNNTGIIYAKENYIFDFLVVCNPDTIMKKFNYSILSNYREGIIAPEIVCVNSKKQNPLNYKYMPIIERLLYTAFTSKQLIILLTAIVLIKLDTSLRRLIYRAMNKQVVNIHACHGSFIIFSSFAIDKIFPVFDEKIFLFCEESDLAMQCKLKGITISYDKNILIYHKEDGSMNLSNDNLKEIHRNSYIYYYDKWKLLKK
ncbi:glycosyltransferase family 2 protein [Bacillus sp. FJAT-28004]|uniref:glycosyltransferase family 2 protein n=1 Tax=Bacillus sp. FJAT-28004 TaxID=1679165 RepID=UPI0006B5E1D3|nr:glycosyltransferase [Bacillus sp. FJAT-28004]